MSPFSRSMPPGSRHASRYFQSLALVTPSQFSDMVRLSGKRAPPTSNMTHSHDDLFGILGISRSASEVQVRTSFLVDLLIGGNHVLPWT